MRFLVTSTSKYPVPPEALVGLIDAMIGWLAKYKTKMDATWANVGSPEGGAIANVNSLEELDAIMLEFPFGAFSDVKVVPLVDLTESLQRSKKAFLAMMPGGGK